MLKRYLLALPALCLAGFVQQAQAAEVVIDPAQAVAPPRTDPGTGICASTIHLKNSFGGFRSPDGADAAGYLNKDWMTDPTITGRVSRLFTTINLRNANDNSLGDFTAAKGMDDYMPFSNSSLAVPRDDDTNIALRIRGYFNVPSTLAGKTIAFGVYCNDLCAMKVGKDKVLLTPVADTVRATSRMIYRVQFKQPGLYPIEVLYYQNGDVGFLEWARTDVDVMECPNDLCTTPLTDSMYMDKFKLIDKSELYSAIVGENASCQECGAPGLNCSMGSYCGDGLCQACDVPDHCGPSCVSCPANARLCSAGRCVECVADDQCPAGRTCDIPNGKCTDPTPCRKNEDCPPGKICDPDQQICVTPPKPCSTTAMCPVGQMCVDGLCKTPPKKCTTDAECAASEYCDTSIGVCRSRLTDRYVGGQAGCSAGQGPSGGGSSGLWLGAAALLGLLGFGLRSRMSRRSSKAAAALLLPVFFFALGNSAHAQDQPQFSINAQTFRPAIGPENIFTVEGSRTPGKWVPMANAVFEWAYRPLRLLSDRDAKTVADTVPNMVTLHLTGGIGLTSWLALGLDLPIVVYQGFDRSTPVRDVPAGKEPSLAGVGDLRVVGKIRIIDNTVSGFGLAFVPQITFPTGDGTQFRGDDAFGFEPRFAFDYRTKGGFIVALNAGIFLRTAEQQARNIKVSYAGARYGLGAYLPLPMNFGLAGELIGSTSFLNAQDIYSPLELYAGARWNHSSGITVNVGGGPGLTPVAGSPQVRLFASIGYLPMARAKEQVKPKVVDLDPDRDGLIGKYDRCPTEYGPPENQGCPDVDTDKDGIVDRLDQCPNEPGPKENNGCPDKDRDGDGLIDRLDSCPDQPGPLENNGCPLLDTDKDGIPDKDDKCPYEPGPKETNGCPPPRKFIKVEEGEIKLLQQILFATNKWDIKPASFPLLDEVVSVLKSRTTMTVDIQGHTDIRGKLEWNIQLSKNRAEAVRKYLVDHGVAAERLHSDGFGPNKPICNEKTAACFDKNRRTQFLVTHQ
ncbi:MAG: OmpA family protein [Polyangia bacterium]